MQPRTRVIIVDDSPEVRLGLRTLVNLVTGVELVGEAASGVEAIYQAEILQPDLILLDLDMGKVPSQPGDMERGELDGSAAIPVLKARQPAARIFVLTVHEDPATRWAAVTAGADAFYVKGRDTGLMLQALQSFSSNWSG